MKEKKEKFSSITHILKFITGIISWVVLVILVLIAMFLLYYFISTKIYAKKGEDYRPAIGLYTILTPSMEPNINPKDVIIDVRVDNPEDIKIGDIITFVSSVHLTQGMVITHRVIDIKIENGVYNYYTKGDNNLSPDIGPAQFNNVLGKVLFKIPKLGLLQQFLATKSGWLIVVVIPALCVIISDILKLFRLKDTKNKVESTMKKEEMLKELEEKNKEKINKNLTARYVKIRKENEPDPIPKKNYVKVSKNIAPTPRVTINDLPKKIELPKLKEAPKIEETPKKKRPKKKMKKN